MSQSIPAPSFETDPVVLSADLPAHRLAEAGGKARGLLTLLHNAIAIPQTAYLPVGAYRAFVQANGLEQTLVRLTQGLDLETRRWEEIWDASLRIRNAFERTVFPSELEQRLVRTIEPIFGDKPLAIRSCAPAEDGAHSHAGLHESYINIRGEAEILAAIRRVWASLWSDRALMYRRELGLDPAHAGMGVLLQEIVPSDTSGIIFTQGPLDETRTIVEAAPGLPGGVVDNAVDTERFVVDRRTGRVEEHTASQATQKLVLGEQGTVLVPLAAPAQEVLGAEELQQVLEMGRRAEELLGTGQDMEWAFADSRLLALQSRPVTSHAAPKTGPLWQDTDKRPWYLSLTRSFANLQALRERIENQVLPEMTAESETMLQRDLSALSCEALDREVRHRRARFEHWQTVYWQDLIPFAHGIRLFGVLYNDTVHPEDPFEFTQILAGEDLLALERNALLDHLAEMVAADDGLRRDLENHILPSTGPFAQQLETFISRFGDLACSTTWCQEGSWGVLRIVLDLATAPHRHAKERHRQSAVLEEQFFQAIAEERREWAADVLDLARASYRLRDDDNLYLGKIQARYYEALDEARKRRDLGQCAWPQDIDELLQESVAHRAGPPPGGDSPPETLAGTPASAGIARGPARIIHAPEDLYAVQSGEVLVCDALDPNMTFIVPLVAAIIERRGGMLVHSAIIAREYGIPCITGVAAATSRIPDGAVVAVDGFKGTVTFL
ncbi:MAG: PEP/pyruvate-binding domain-containing protein [Thermodesulfobacteriota bacterium]